jgi:predicted nuclease of predicted toxin-antitoxin system
MTKDADFVHSFVLTGRPKRLLLISTGNINNQNPEELIRDGLPSISAEFDAGSEFLELSRSGLIIHK